MAARNWDWWYATAPDGLLMSVSQYKLSTGCLRRWGFRHLLKLREEMGKAASTGDGHHLELEHWVNLRKMPTTKAALAALRYAPAPGVAMAEVPVRVDVNGAGWLGFIDLVYDWEGPIGLGQGTPKALTSTGHTVIHDWKFTGNLKNAMTEEQLAEDEAACLYALEAYQGGAQLVSCRWVYVEMNCPSPRAKEVWVLMPLEKVVARLHEMSEHVSTTTNPLVQLHRKGEKPVTNAAVLELECDTGECYAFLRDCPYKPGTDKTHEAIKSGEIKGCEPTARLRMPAPPGENMNDFKAAMSNFPGNKPATTVGQDMQAAVNATREKEGRPPLPQPGQKAPPAAPPKVPPKLPPKTIPKPPTDEDISDEEAQRLIKEHMAAQRKSEGYHDAPEPVVERGFVNSMAAPVTPPASPEEAAIAQGVKPPTDAPAIEDDLTALNKDQLRAMCAVEGIDLAKKRPQEATLRSMIRVHRIQRAAGAQPEEPRDTSNDTRAFTKEEQAEISKILEKVDTAALVTKAPPKAPLKAPRPDEHVPDSSIVEDMLSSRAFEEPTQTLAEATREAIQAVRTAVLSGPDMLELHDIVARASEVLFEATGKRDYRHIPYTGAADLCLAVQDLFETDQLKARIVLIDSSTPEGSTLLTTLTQLARGSYFKLIDGRLV